MPDAAWAVLPQLVWTTLFLIAILVFRKDVGAIAVGLAWRLKSGAAVKLGGVEVGGTYVGPGGAIAPGHRAVVEHVDSGERERQREQYYAPNRHIFLVHKVTPSPQPDQLYELVIYLVPHKEATLASVQRVEYYFGPYWGHKVFTVSDRARSFAIATSAYGPFVCTAELVFTDGERVTVHRYIDFEMGALPLAQSHQGDGAA